MPISNLSLSLSHTHIPPSHVPVKLTPFPAPGTVAQRCRRRRDHLGRGGKPALRRTHAAFIEALSPPSTGVLRCRPHQRRCFKPTERLQNSPLPLTRALLHAQSLCPCSGAPRTLPASLPASVSTFHPDACCAQYVQLGAPLHLDPLGKRQPLCVCTLRRRAPTLKTRKLTPLLCRLKDV